VGGRTAAVADHLQEPAEVAVSTATVAEEATATVTGTADPALNRNRRPLKSGRRCFRGSLTGLTAL